MKIIIFCGAHKTASTHFFRSLERDKEGFEARKIALFSPQMMYDPIEQITNKLRAGVAERDVRQEMCETLADLAPGAETLFMFDENLMGGTQKRLLFKDSALYPWAAQRLRRFVSVLPANATIKLAFSTRELSQFIPSAYAESLGLEDYLEFEEYISRASVGELRWVNLIEQIVLATDSPAFVWRYEDYPCAARALMGRLVDEDFAKQLNFDRPPDNRGISARGIEEIKQAHLQGLPRPKFRKLRLKYPKSMLYPPLEAFSAADRAVLLRNYEKDWARIPALTDVRAIKVQPQATLTRA